MFEDTFLDVAIGLTFTFALLSLVTTSVTEGCANLMRTRSRALGSWIENMLGDKLTCREMMAHPLVRALCPSGREVPDYISAQTFMMVLLETLAPAGADGQARKRPASFAELTAMIEGLGESPQLRKLLTNLCTNARGDLREAEHAIADWFDGSMQRLSGWYARQAQLAAFGFASVLTLSLNADSLMIADVLWQDDDLRAAVVERASAEASEQARVEPTSAASGEDPGVDAAIDTLQRLDAFPLGWSNDPLDPRSVPTSWIGLLTKLLGFGVTVLAITLGAPFWFDLLSRFVGLRSTGKQPETNRNVRASEAEPREPTP